MFDETTIQALINSVGWDEPISNTLVIDEINKLSFTGRLFNGFHPLVTVENVNNTAGNDVLTNEQLNAELYGFKKQAALEVLNKVFNNSPQFNPLEDYGGTVVKFISVLSGVYGLTVSANVLKMMSTSLRTNDAERRTKYGIAKVELEGFKNENGVTVSRGINSLLYSAIIEAQNVIFPNKLLIDGSIEW